MVLCLCFGLVACSEQAKFNKEKEAASKVVKGYVTALVQAYQDDNSTYLEPFAAPAQMSFINLNIMSYKADNKRFLTRLDKFEVKNVRQSQSSEEKAELLVDTDEEWTFWFVERGTETKMGVPTKIRYNNIYHMVKPQGKWFIIRMEVKEIK